jgi:hypothetical protein
MNKLDILRNFITEFENHCIPSINFDDNCGYTSNFYLAGKQSYAKRIGLEFIKHNIPFSSLYDIGYGKFDSVEGDPEFQEKYIKACQQTPNHIFLENILPHKEQKEVLLKVLSKFNLSLCFDNPMGIERIATDNLTKLNSIFYILDNLKSIGLDKLNINEELIDKVNEYYVLGLVNNPNIAISFINQGFSFDKDFMDICFKNSFFTHFTRSQESNYNNLCCTNNENRIKCNYNDINSSLAINEDKSIKKNKI